MEGVWQGLKVFDNQGVDKTKFTDRKDRDVVDKIKRMAGTKRGQIKGHFGGRNEPLLNYASARTRIYLPTYEWVLDNKLQDGVEALLAMLREGKNLVFLDCYTNADVEIEKPLSHAQVLRNYLLKKLKERGE